AEGQTGAAQDPARKPGRATGELDIRAPELHDERTAEPHRDPSEGQPVSVDQVGVAGSPPGGATELAEHQWKQQRPGRTLAQVADHPGAVRDPVVTEPERRDDLDLHPPPAHVLDRVGHEPAGHVLRRARVRGGEYSHLHAVASSRGAKTTGSASTSRTNA